MKNFLFHFTFIMQRTRKKKKKISYNVNGSMPRRPLNLVCYASKSYLGIRTLKLPNDTWQQNTLNFISFLGWVSYGSLLNSCCLCMLQILLTKYFATIKTHISIHQVCGAVRYREEKFHPTYKYMYMYVCNHTCMYNVCIMTCAFCSIAI